MDRVRFAWLSSVLDQFKTNARLRLGLATVLLVLWLYAVLWALDMTALLRAEAAQLAGQLDDSRVLSKQTIWTGRAKAAAQQLEAVRALMWNEPEQGLAEAQMRDWLATLASKSGLVLRESSLLRTEAGATGSGAVGEGKAAALPAGYARVRLHLTADFNPMASAAMLAELAQGDRMVRVERLRILTVTKPQLLEMELGAVVRLTGAKS